MMMLTMMMIAIFVRCSSKTNAVLPQQSGGW